LETYNDLDGNVVNFFQVLRDQPDELIRKISLTPWARAEYELSLYPPKQENAIESARRFFVAHWMGFRQSLKTTAGQVRFNIADRKNPGVLYQDGLDELANRLIGVQIECKPYTYVIDKHDMPGTLIYFDPPYVAETRRHDNVYMVEFTEKDHIAAAELLRSAKGYVVVSGYACPLYTELYENHGWERKDKEAQTNSGGKRIESLWLSPRTSEALKEN
jgi:DNA adenine methylase